MAPRPPNKSRARKRPRSSRKNEGFGAQVARTAQRSTRGALRLLLLAAGGCVVLSVLVTVPLRFFAPPTSAFMIRSRMVQPSEYPDYQFRQQWRDLDQISPYAALAVLASEDQRFPEHTGIDVGAISDALRERSEGGRTRGASTISQQVAKNLYLWPGRSLARKGLEAYLTLLLELFLPKQRILEIYLNIAEFGVGVYGAEAAARRYFDKPASNLTREEAALMATVLPAPARLLLERPNELMRSRQAWILGQMRNLGDVGYLQKISTVGDE